MFDFHRGKGYADLYSLHSWCGILTFVLYFVQVGGSAPRGVGEGRAWTRPRQGCMCHTGAHCPGCVPESEGGALAQLDAAFRS